MDGNPIFCVPVSKNLTSVVHDVGNSYFYLQTFPRFHILSLLKTFLYLHHILFLSAAMTQQVFFLVFHATPVLASSMPFGPRFPTVFREFCPRVS